MINNNYGITDPLALKRLNQYRDRFRRKFNESMEASIDAASEARIKSLGELTKLQEETIKPFSAEIQEAIGDVNRLGAKLNSSLEKYREPVSYEEMKKELEERLLRAKEIKDVLYTASQETGQFLTREQILDAISEILNK